MQTARPEIWTDAPGAIQCAGVKCTDAREGGSWNEMRCRRWSRNFTQGEGNSPWPSWQRTWPSSHRSSAALSAGAGCTVPDTSVAGACVARRWAAPSVARIAALKAGQEMRGLCEDCSATRLHLCNDQHRWVPRRTAQHDLASALGHSVVLGSFLHTWLPPPYRHLAVLQFRQRQKPSGLHCQPGVQSP